MLGRKRNPLKGRRDRRPAPAAAAAALCAAAALAAVPLRWDVETSRAQPAMFTAYRGETLELEARLFSGGRPLEAGPGAAPGLYWQTDGMGTAWWRAPASAASNTLSAVWSPSNDVGAASYSCFIGEPGGGWRAAFRLRMLASPGAVPNELPLPARVIDFAAVDVTNAPWADAAAVAAAIAAATNALPPAAADLSAATNYTDAAVAALSNHVEAAIAAIPSGGGEPQGWVTQSPPVAWTNAPVAVAVPDGGSLTFTGDWPDAAPVYLRVTASGAYTVPQGAVRLLGYAAWPPAGSTFQCAVWFDGTRYLVNLILSE